VGRGYTDHYLDWVVGVFGEDTGTSKGPNSAARCDFPGYGAVQNVGWGPALQAAVMNASDSGIRNYYTNGRGLTGNWDGPTGRISAVELKEVMLNGIDRLLNVLCLTDDDVQPDNRVTLSALPPDANGAVPKVRMVQRGRTARSVRNREFLANRAAALLRGAGAARVIRIDLPPILLHVHSTMRMGQSEADSVLDDNAESRAVARLFVADNSALANSLGGPNPTLTTQALATRTAEKIFQRCFAGDPWVGTEAPVPSTDARVTRRLAELGL
jgi:choline dehydrogenase-like flavoprotein